MVAYFLSSPVCPLLKNEDRNTDIFLEYANTIDHSNMQSLSIFSTSEAINGLFSSITHFEKMANEYSSLVKHNEFLSKEIERLGSPLSRDVSISTLSLINTSFENFSKLSDNLQVRASNLNYVSNVWLTEYNYFQKVAFHIYL